MTNLSWLLGVLGNGSQYMECIVYQNSRIHNFSYALLIKILSFEIGLWNNFGINFCWLSLVTVWAS